MEALECKRKLVREHFVSFTVTLALCRCDEIKDHLNAREWMQGAALQKQEGEKVKGREQEGSRMGRRRGVSGHAQAQCFYFFER